jgi:hypothetical protein
MNRQQRRQAERKPSKFSRSHAIYSTKFTLEHESFDSIERLFAKLRIGELEWTKEDGYVIRGLSGEYLHIVSALEGFIDCWRTIADGEDISYDDSALRRLAKSLEYEKPLNMVEIESAYNVVKVQRSMYRALPKLVISKYAKQTQSKFRVNDEIRDLISNVV